MSLPVALRVAAQVEFDDAHDFYQGRRAGLGKRFSDAVGRVFKSIGANPRIHAVVLLDIRKAVVRGFPYCVYYYEEPQQVVVISVFHTSRDPAIWMGRR